jgi:hypothetical protein
MIKKLKKGNNMKQYIGTKIIKAKLETKNGEEGYKVVYEDGYVSWSPKDVFEKAYHHSGNLTFGDAIHYLKLGSKVARKGWNGKGMFLFLSPKPWIEAIEEIKWTDYKIDSFICMKTAQDTIVPWLASQSDMLAEDWVIVE